MLAEVKLSCGRLYLSVAGICVAMEGDKCRAMLPEDACEPIPQDELDAAMIGDKRCSELPIDVVRFFRGDNWSGKSLEYVAAKINELAKAKRGRVT